VSRNPGLTLVTGAAGFIGWHVASQLAQRGIAVRATDLHPPARTLHGGEIEFRSADLLDPAPWAGLLNGVETVLHLASAHLQVNADENHYRAVNVGGATQLVHAAADAGVQRFVHVSTVGIYGHVAQPPATEDAPRSPENLYERTKLEGEQAVMAAAQKRGLDLIIIRPAWVFGLGCPRTAKLARTIGKGSFVFIGAGSNLRHPIYIDDFVAGLVAAATTTNTLARRDFILAGPTPMPLHDIVRDVATALGVATPRRRLPRPLAYMLGLIAEGLGALTRREPPLSRRSLAFFENDNAFDISAARTAFGFTPSTTFLEGMQRTLAEERR